MKLSCLYNVRNEIEFLPLSLKCVEEFVDEIVLVDNRSTDGTVEFCRDYQSKNPKQVKFIQMDTIFDEGTESGIRNQSLKHVTGDWVMMLDADQLMSDRWPVNIRPLFKDKRYDAIRVAYEHWVGSFEYIHTQAREKQYNHRLHPGVCLVQTVFFRRVPKLKVRSAMEVSNAFREWHHANADRSLDPERFTNVMDATVFHAGFCKREMMRMSRYRIHRGDYGHTDEIKAQFDKELVESGNPFHFIGPVCRVSYGPERLPSCMRHMFDNTYKLDIDGSGFIKSRTLIATGEKV
jgi:hypothetical protein